MRPIGSEDCTDAEIEAPILRKACGMPTESMDGMEFCGSPKGHDQGKHEPKQVLIAARTAPPPPRIVPLQGSEEVSVGLLMEFWDQEQARQAALGHRVVSVVAPRAAMTPEALSGVEMRLRDHTYPPIHWDRGF